MGSLPQLSVLKGTAKAVRKDQLHRIFEHNVDTRYGQNVATKFHGEWRN